VQTRRCLGMQDGIPCANQHRSSMAMRRDSKNARMSRGRQKLRDAPNVCCAQLQATRSKEEER